MKHHLLISILAIAFALNSNATVITVDNNANSPGQYTNLQTAINAAVAGDTIYISGSNAGYGNITVNRTLTIIGTGYNPIKQMPLVSSVGSITFDSVLSVSGASGTYMAGINSSTIYDNYGAKNITLERNYFNSSINPVANSSGWIIKDNIINYNISINNATNMLIENNLFYLGTVYYSNQPSVMINHNVFMATIGGGAFALYSVSFATIMNNIFWGTTPLGSGVANNTFNNNLTFQTSNDAIPGGSNSGSGNLVAMNPQFVNVSSPGISFSNDYNVTSASAAHNAGTDLTDLGVFGGASPFPDLTGMPAIPQMLQMNIANPVILPAGTLNVTFKAKKNN